MTVTTPIKKLKGGELTEEERACNRRLSSLRVVVENALWGAKVHRIVHDPFRGRKAGFDDQAMVVTVSLHNFKCDQRAASRQQPAA